MILRVTCLLLVFVIAIMFNRLTVFLNLIGSIAGTFFCFILPVLVYEKNMPNISYQEFYLHRAIMTLGIIFAILGIASSLSSIFWRFLFITVYAFYGSLSVYLLILNCNLKTKGIFLQVRHYYYLDF